MVINLKNRLHCLFTLFLTVLGLRCCAQAFPSCSEQGATLRFGAWASHCDDFCYCGPWVLCTRASVAAALGLSSCGLLAGGCVGFSSCGM